MNLDTSKFKEDKASNDKEFERIIGLGFYHERSRTLRDQDLRYQVRVNLLSYTERKIGNILGPRDYSLSHRVSLEVYCNDYIYKKHCMRWIKCIAKTDNNR